MASWVTASVVMAMCTGALATPVHLRDLLTLAHAQGSKRAGEALCPPWEPFRCPSQQCIPIKFLCDGSPDCDDGYDEDAHLCTAAIRPPVVDTAAFFSALLQQHGPDFMAKIFGTRAAGNMAPMGGVDKVAVAITQSPTAEEFGKAVGMDGADVEKMRTVLQAIADGDVDGFAGSEADDFRFFAVKLIETGF